MKITKETMRPIPYKSFSGKVMLYDPSKTVVPKPAPVSPCNSSTFSAHDQLPHQLLLNISRGTPITNLETVTSTDPTTGEEMSIVAERIHYPSMSERIDAAKACAQYFAPKLSTQAVVSTTKDELSNVLEELAQKLPV